MSAMRFRTISETPLKPLDRVFRQSAAMWLVGVMVGLVLMALGVVSIFRVGGAFGWIFATIAALVMLPFAYLFVTTFHTENWILRYSPPRLLIKIRSHANLHMNDDDPVILELDTSEIAWVRKVREKISTQLNPVIFLELKLKAEDLSVLTKQFGAESERRHKGFRVVHDPVRLSNGIIRIEWRGGGWIVPSIDKAIAMLESAVPIHESGESQAKSGLMRSSII